MNRKERKIPEPNFSYGDIVLAPRWRLGGSRRFVIAEIVDSWYVHPAGRYKDGYEAGWRYRIKRGRKEWEELYEPRLLLLVKAER